MNWELQRAEEAASPQPGGNAVDEFIRRNVMMAKLEDAGLIKQTARPESDPDDERRQYYGLTEAGRARLREEAERLAQWAEAAREGTAG